MTVTKQNIQGISSEDLVGVSYALENPFTPGPVNSGAVDFNATDYYSATRTGSAGDNKKLFGVFWIRPTTTDTMSILCCGFVFDTGKSTTIRTPFLATIRATGEFRIVSGGTKGANLFTANMPVAYSLNEWNMYAIGVDNVAGDFTQAHWSPSTGFSSGTFTPSTNAGQDFEWSQITDIIVGGTQTVLTPNQLYDGYTALAYLTRNYYDASDSAIYNQLIDASGYYNPQVLEQGLIMHSGNTSTFPTNAGTLYSGLTASGAGLADVAGPTPPFTL